MGLQKAAGDRLHRPPGEFESRGWSIVMTHEVPILETAGTSSRYRVVYGDTRHAEMRGVVQPLMANPAERGGRFSGYCPVAVWTASKPKV